MRLIDVEELLEHLEACLQNGRPLSNLYDLSEIVRYVKSMPTASPWHRVEDGLPEMSELIPRFVCSGVLVLYDAESGYTDIGYVREKPDGVDWMWGKPHKNPTHWMHFEPPKEEEV